MHAVTWDEELNGIILTLSTTPKRRISPPRPVYNEELDLLGFSKVWEYPKASEPLLWAIGRRYYYRGFLVAEAKGGNMFSPPQIVLHDKGKNLKLAPINISRVLEKNLSQLFILENEALDFIEQVFHVYESSGYAFAVAYSGGKDSQVVLDLVTRVVPSDMLFVIFSDTTVELGLTYENVRETCSDCAERYPQLRFFTATPPKSCLDLWREFGPPSRVHRWCCTVIKTAPFYSKLALRIADCERPKVVVFEGVRADESDRRSRYERIAEGAKHLFVANVRPILHWNTAEVFLYSYLRKLRINRAYRLGLTRVGCAICPFASEWSEYIINAIEPSSFSPFLEILAAYARAMGLSSSEDVRTYIARGHWKTRAGGKGIVSRSNITFQARGNSVKAVIARPRESFLEWAKVAGDIFYRVRSDESVIGELRIRNRVYPFSVYQRHGKQVINIDNMDQNLDLRSKIMRILYKVAFCVHCGACEAECPTGALSTVPKVRIQPNKCVHCGNCLFFTEKGCLASRSVHQHVGGVGMENKKGGIDRYSTFGLREEWLASFLNLGDQWLLENNLGPKQVMAVLRWLIEAELVDPKSKGATELAHILGQIYPRDNAFVVSIIWNNLYYHSPVVEWYCNCVAWGESCTKQELKARMAETYPHLSKGTISNPIDALVNMFDNSCLGTELGIGMLTKSGRIVTAVRKAGSDNVHPFTIAYSLYKVAEYLGRTELRLSELYEPNFPGGPSKLFGVSRPRLENILRGLQEDRQQLLRVDLIADLDNIHLRDDLSPLDIIRFVEERLK